MTPNDYIRALKRRWFDIVLAVAVALGVGYAISSVAPPGPVTSSYEATAILLASGNPFTSNAPSLEALAELTVVGEVPERAAAYLESPDRPADLAAAIETSINKEAGILRIKALATEEQQAIDLANGFAKGLTRYLRDLQAQTVTEEAGALQVQLEGMEGEIAGLDEAIDATRSPTEEAVLTAQRDALVRQYGLVYETYRQLAAGTLDPISLDIVQSASAHEISAGGFQPPRSLVARLLLAGLLGLLAGVVIVLILDRFDQRIRTRKVAEEAFGYPVLAEIPYLARHRRKADRIDVLTEPRGAIADAYRIVAAILSMPPSAVSGNGNNGNGNGTGNGNGHAHARVYADGTPPPPPDLVPPPRRILVVSPGPSDGKTTVTANLAAVFGARGKRTIVYSCDLRRPRIHRMFGVELSPGLSDVLSVNGTGLPQLPVVRSPIAANVAVVPSGQPPQEPGELLGSDQMRLALLIGQEHSDVVVIDTAPILTTSDAAHLITDVDAVLIVARAGRTTVDVAHRTSDMLRRLNAPVVGVILHAAAEMSVPRRYYSYKYYRRPQPVDTPRKGFPRLVRHRQKSNTSGW